MPHHLTHELDALRGLWELRRQSLQQQARNARLGHRGHLAAFLRGMSDGLELSRMELERTIHGAVVELGPVPVFPYPEAKGDERAAALLVAARAVAVKLDCIEAPRMAQEPRCGKCSRCVLCALCFPGAEP
jgi:hypothetical protein